MDAPNQPREQRVRSVSILGSTGSIGCNTLDLLERNPEQYKVEVLTAFRNVELLAKQALRVRPQVAVVGDPEGYAYLKQALSGTNIEVAAGEQALLDAAEIPVEWLMVAIVGAAGLKPTLSAVRQGGIVALANKESLVCAGTLLMEEVEKCGTTLLPVDSEHNAIFQVFDYERQKAVEKIILTASGGPFREMSLAEMASVTPAQAVKHPNWVMGAKISVDSATMMNKGLEFIEAFHLFPVTADQIDILLHPQSVIHSMVGYCDGSVLAQLGTPDMRTPIAYTLGWPNRITAPSKRLDLAEIGTLTFEKPDNVRFPALSLARETLQSGGSAPTILNAANEVAVAGFLKSRIGFLDIIPVVRKTLDALPEGALECLEDVLDVDRRARIKAEALIKGMQ